MRPANNPLLGFLLVLAFRYTQFSDAAPEAKKGDPVQVNPGFTVVIDDVGKYLKQDGVPKRKGPVKFNFDGKITKKDGKNVIKASFLRSYNGFRMGYDLTGVLKADKLEKRELNINDFAQITITYTDDLLDSKGLNEKDVKGLIEQLNEPANKVRVGFVIIPGGEMLEFSPPMKKLMMLADKAHDPLQARLGDQRIQNEVAVILGAIGNETTVPALIQVYPEGNLRKAKEGSPEYLKGVCLTFALTYLTGQPIGRSRWGADLKPENKKLWNDWWAKEGKTFKVPAEKPNATWVPEYPILTKEWAGRCREEFAKGEQREQKPPPKKDEKPPE